MRGGAGGIGRRTFGAPSFAFVCGGVIWLLHAARVEAITNVCFGDLAFIGGRECTCYYANFGYDELRNINDDVALRAEFYVNGLRRCFDQGVYVGRYFYEDVKGCVCRFAFFRRVRAIGRLLKSKGLLVYFLVRRSVVLALLVGVLMKAALCARVLRYLAGIRAAFRCVTICRVFRLHARGDISLAKLCVRGIGARVRFAVRASTYSLLGILYIGRGVLLLVCLFLLLVVPL